MKKEHSILEQGFKEKTDQTFFENQKFVDRNCLAKIISLSPSYISKLVKEEGLPSYKIGKSLRFKITEVVEFLNERKRP